MEDRYLYKAKRKDNGEWVVGSYINGGFIIKTNHTECVDIFENTICQCTGLKDKNGKLIWENDIVNCTDEECCGYISWNESEAGFYFNVLIEDGRFEEEHVYDYQDCMEVIGNIFDNKELLWRNAEWAWNQYCLTPRWFGRYLTEERAVQEELLNHNSL